MMRSLAMLGTAQGAGLLRHRVPRNDIPRWGTERADEPIPEPFLTWLA